MSEPSPAVKSEDFWFEDGDIILSITEEGVEHQFCVHKAILTIASPVFRDMLSMPQPSEGESPVVPLQGDSVYDLKALICALYYSCNAPKLTNDMTLGILRLSHKYQIEGLQQWMRRKLQKDWPLRRSDYLARVTNLDPPGYRTSQAIEVFETAQRCEANELLPSAIYELACAWGTQWEDIIGVTSPETVARVSLGHARSRERLRALAAGGSDLMIWQPASPSKKTIFDHRSRAFKECQIYSTPTSYCKTLLPAFRFKVASLLLDGSFALPAIRNCGRADLGDACTTCKDWFMAVLKNKIQELWESIPTLFDLPEVDTSESSQSATNTRRHKSL